MLYLNWLGHICFFSPFSFSPFFSPSLSLFASTPSSLVPSWTIGVIDVVSDRRSLRCRLYHVIGSLWCHGKEEKRIEKKRRREEERRELLEGKKMLQKGRKEEREEAERWKRGKKLHPLRQRLLWLSKLSMSSLISEVISAASSMWSAPCAAIGRRIRIEKKRERERGKEGRRNGESCWEEKKRALDREKGREGGKGKG